MSNICIHNAKLIRGLCIIENSAIYIENGKIVEIFDEKSFQYKNFEKDVVVIDAKKNYVSAGFIDTHIHGFGGFGVTDMTAESILGMSEKLAHFGVTSFLPTTYTSTEKVLVQTVSVIKQAMGKEKGANILGIHLEGPFISPNHIGGQDKNALIPIDINLVKNLVKASGNSIINMTVAPELEGIEDLAKCCDIQNIKLQIGHSNANNEEMQKALNLGINHITHMFNAMSPMHKRELGVVGTGLINPEFSCEIIVDGVHVRLDLVKHLFDTKPDDKVVLITDSLAPAGTNDENMIILGEEVYFDRCFYRKRDNMIVGSALTMLEAIKNLVLTGVCIEKAVLSATENPAKIMGLKNKGEISLGFDADIIIFNDKLEIINTIINGKVII